MSAAHPRPTRHGGRRRAPATVLAIAVVVAIAAGCDSEDQESVPTQASIAPTTAPDIAFPRTVEHALGETEVHAAPERVVALDRTAIDSAMALGLPLVGYTTFADPEGALPEYFGEALDEHASDAVWVGDLMAPNLEAISELSPDLILTAAVRHEDIYGQLTAIAPTIATESGGGGWKDGMRLVADATARQELADTLIADYESRAAAVGADVNAAADDPTISVVRFADAIRLYQPVSFSGTVLEDAGLARPDSQQDREEFIRIISEEELALADGDVLFYTVADNDAVRDNAGAIQSRPLWNTLAAVQSGNAHPVADDSWMSGVGIYGAHLILDDLADTFGVDPHR